MDGVADQRIEMDGDVPLYVRDEHAWAEEQIAILTNGRLEQLDRAHLAEYLHDMTIRDRRELGSRMVVLLLHLLKWQCQQELRSRSWRVTIRTQQVQIRDILEGTPSIRTYCEPLWVQSYRRAVDGASDETGLSTKVFPTDNPWTLDAALVFEPLI